MFSHGMTSRRSRGPSPAWWRSASILAVLALCACSNTPPKFLPPPKRPPQAVLPTPQPVQLEDVQWKVLQSGSEPYFALTTKGYEALSRNIAELTRWAQEASYQIDFYRRSRKQEPKANE